MTLGAGTAKKIGVVIIAPVPDKDVNDDARAEIVLTPSGMPRTGRLRLTRPI